MKKILNKILIIALILTATFSCKDPDNAVYTVTEDFEYGAVLRTLEITNLNFNIFDLESEFAIEFEEQDEEYGDLLSKVDVYVSHVNNTAGTTSSEVLATSLSASEFSLSEDNQLPSAEFAMSFSETLSVLSLSDGEYFGGDEFVFRLELTLTDGRVFTDADASSTLEGSYFSSPFSYTATIICVPETPFTGEYVIDMQDSYGDGWQGSTITFTIDGEDTSVTIPDYWAGGVPAYTEYSDSVTVPDDAQTLVLSWAAGDYPSECTFQIYAPSGNLVYDGGPSPAEGEFALNLCDE